VIYAFLSSSYVFFHTSSIHGGEFGMAVKTKPKWTFFLQGKISKSWFQCWYRFSWPVPFF